MAHTLDGLREAAGWLPRPVAVCTLSRWIPRQRNGAGGPIAALAGSRKHGQSNKYVHDLLAAWQGVREEGAELPPLLSRLANSLS